MDRLTWNPEWETGYALVDEQHRPLLAEFDEFLDAIEQRVHGQHVANLLEFLVEFLEEHCEEEEIQMRATHYPRLAQHMAFHAHMRATASRLGKAAHQDPEALAEEVTAFLHEWVEHHIKVEDKLMAQHLIHYSRRGPKLQARQANPA
jgi:hemerythrin